MKLKFWKKKPVNLVAKSAREALSVIDKILPASATDEDFALAIASLASRWCCTTPEGTAVSRGEALRRAGFLYHAINDRLYKTEQVAEDGFVPY